MAQNRTHRVSIRVATNLNPREQVLWGYLNPWLEKLERAGWNKRRVADAVIDHYVHTGEEILPEELRKLLSPPTELLIEYKQRRGKPNIPSGQQQLVLNRLVPELKKRQKTIQILSRIYVVDLLGSLAFKQIIEEIRAHNFVEPQVQPCTSGKCYQGRKLIWPEG